MVIIALFAIPQTLQADDGDHGDNRQKDDKELRESLKKAQKHFLKALEILGETGVKSYEKHLPEIKERSTEMLEKSHDLLEKWQKTIEQELDEHKKRESQPEQSDDKEPLPLI